MASRIHCWLTAQIFKGRGLTSKGKVHSYNALEAQQSFRSCMPFHDTNLSCCNAIQGTQAHCPCQSKQKHLHRHAWQKSRLKLAHLVRRCMKDCGMILLGVLQPYASLCSNREDVVPHCTSQPLSGFAPPQGYYDAPHWHCQGLQTWLYMAITDPEQ